VGIGEFAMSWEKPFEFAEGDSGTPSPIIQQWNELQAQAKVREIVPLSLDGFMAEVLDFAREKSHSSDARAKAYGLVWQIGLQRAQMEQGQ
jgi:hypothetical protein